MVYFCLTYISGIAASLPTSIESQITNLINPPDMDASQNSPHAKKTILHVGCGQERILGKRGFDLENWHEVRLDIEADALPDIICSMISMPALATGSIDAIYSSHNLEHLEPHEVPVALHEFERVLAPEGFILLTCPDLQKVCELVASNRLDEPAYFTRAGIPIAPMDILFGWRTALASGKSSMAHRCGFTGKVLEKALRDAGFVAIAIKRVRFDLYAVASKKRMSAVELRDLFNGHWGKN